ncbi:MAG TPA: Lrp/AsnC family transcriptional regulator [Caulobacteraceae bacterium]
MGSSAGYDETDLRILTVLQEDASLSINEVAERVHLSQNACWRRIRRLDDEGFIRKRVALLDAGKLGVGVTVFVSIKTSEHSEAWLSGFAATVRKMPEVVELHRMTGEIDYLIKLRVRDIEDYDDVYKRLIRSVKLSDVSAAFVMEEIKQTTALPLRAAYR